MIENLKFALKNTAIYGLGNASTKIIGLILLPLYLDYLTTYDYGVLGILEITAQIIVSVFGLGLFASLTRWYWDQDYSDKRRTIFFTILSFLLAVVLILIGILMIISRPLSMLLFKSPDYTYLIKLMSVSCGLQIIAVVTATLMKIQARALLHSVTQIFNLIISMSLTIVFIAGMNRNIAGIYEAQICGYIAYLLMLSKYIVSNIEFKFEPALLKSMLNYSYPLMISSIAGLILVMTDRYALNYLCSLSDVGIYSLGFKIANSIKVFIVTSIQLAISPIIYQMVDQPGAKRFYAKLMTYCTLIIMIFILIVSLFSRELITFMDKKHVYYDAYKVVPVIALSVLFGMLYYIAAIGITIEKKTKIIAQVTFIMAGLSVVLNLILTPRFKYLGAAFATLITMIVHFTIIFIRAQRVYRIPFELKKVFKIIVTGLLLYLISLLLYPTEILIKIPLKLLIILLLPFLLWIWNFYDDIELLRIKEGWLQVQHKVFRFKRNDNQTV